MKVIIENSIMDEDNLLELNHFLMVCISAKNENELRNEIRLLEEFGSFENLEERGIRYGFGKHHFWMAEKQFRDEWKRILFVNLTEQN